MGFGVFLIFVLAPSQKDHSKTQEFSQGTIAHLDKRLARQRALLRSRSNPNGGR